MCCVSSQKCVVFISPEIKTILLFFIIYFAPYFPFSTKDLTQNHQGLADILFFSKAFLYYVNEAIIQLDTVYSVNLTTETLSVANVFDEIQRLNIFNPV